MKNSKIIIFAVLLLLAGFFIFFGSKDTKSPVVNNTEPQQTAGIDAGCYVSRTGQDVYTLDIAPGQEGHVYGTLVFKNFQKDSSSGIFNGIYKDGILLGEYAFTSEGTDSVMQVIFKKSGDDFIRGYGEVDESGTRFKDVSKITFDPSSSLNVFKNEQCAKDNVN
jgi:hypothetical protein